MAYNWDLNEKKLMDAIDIEGHIAKYINVNRHEATCPFHDDHDPSLKISSKKQVAKCFACGWSGNVVKFHMNYNGMNKQKAMEQLAEMYGVSIEPFTEGPTIDYSWTKHYDEASKFFNFYLMHTEPAMNYLKDRGITDKTIEAYRIGICPKNKSLEAMLRDKYPDDNVLDSDLFYPKSGDPKYGSRIIFPLMNHYGTAVIGWAGRYVSPVIENKKLVAFNSDIPNDSISKYLNTMDDHSHQGGYLKDYYLYGYHIAKDYTTVYVVEGYMDVVSMYQAGYQNTVAVGGTSLTPNQFNKISNKGIILSLDADDAGVKAALQITIKYWYKDFRYGVYPKGTKDANDALQKGNGEIPIRVLNLVDYIKYVCEELKILDGLSTDDRIKWYKAILMTAEAIDPSSDQGFLLKSMIKKYLLWYMGLQEPMLTTFVTDALSKLGGK